MILLAEITGTFSPPTGKSYHDIHSMSRLSIKCNGYWYNCLVTYTVTITFRSTSRLPWCIAILRCVIYRSLDYFPWVLLERRASVTGGSTTFSFFERLVAGRSASVLVAFAFPLAFFFVSFTRLLSFSMLQAVQYQSPSGTSFKPTSSRKNSPSQLQHAINKIYNQYV
jgi:hypothetical protein